MPGNKRASNWGSLATIGFPPAEIRLPLIQALLPMPKAEWALEKNPIRRLSF